MSGFRRILMATDFSPASDAAVAEAARLARESGATLVLLHVYETPAGAAVPYLPATGYLDSLVAARTESENRMENLLAREVLQGLNVRPVVERGVAASQIVEAAVRESADLIVMGTHGRRGAARLILGSVAASVIARAACPVLTVRMPEPREVASKAPAA